jgi:predicted nucleic acid-binding protein
MPIGADPSLVVADASAVVALLADAGDAGSWAATTFADAELVAPSLMPYEVANILRRQEARSAIDGTAARLALGELSVLRIELWPFDQLAGHAWRLRNTLTFYDATYVALAELLGAPLVTLDRRLAGASGPTCQFIVFEP